MKLRLLFGLAAAVVLGVTAASATADPTNVPVCHGPETTAVAGTHGNLTITGNVFVADGTTLDVRGNLTIAPGACLDAFTLGTVTVGGNILVGKDAILALGCSPGALGPPFDQPPCSGQTTSDTVGGNIVATQPHTMYLTASAVRGNVISNGGGGQSARFESFPIKEMTIGGNLIVQGWQGAWIGLLANHVRGNVIFSDNSAAISGTPQGPDSSEVSGNVVGGNLICQHNDPAAQIGDAPRGPNSVSGRAIGECAAPGLLG